jgi:cell division cycle protein 37
VEQLETKPSRDCPPGNDPSKLEQTYDGMLLSLLKQVGEESRIKIKEAGVLEADREPKLAKALATGMEEHAKRLADTIKKDIAALETEEKEQKKHITSDDMHDGFENKVSFGLCSSLAFTYLHMS